METDAKDIEIEVLTFPDPPTVRTQWVRAERLAVVEAENARLREALGWYATTEPYGNNLGREIGLDFRSRAREALGLPKDAPPTPTSHAE